MPNTRLRPGFRLDRAATTARLLLVALVALSIVACRGRTLLEPERDATPSTAAPRFESDLARLRSQDFVERSRAAERLVAAGEAALPALGRAGASLVDVPGGTRVSATEPVLASILGSLDDEAVRRNLDAPWAGVRRASAVELGRRGGWTAVPALIERMEDEDASVRAAAAASLRRLTNRFFGFRANGPTHLRAAAAERWRTWWNVEGRRGEDAPPTGRAHATDGARGG